MATQTSKLTAQSSPLTAQSSPLTAQSSPLTAQSSSSLQPPASRSGVILLVLLGMLALFTATAFAFVVIASHANKTSKALKKVDRVVFAPQEDLQEIFDQVATGAKTSNRRSVLRGQSLLEDIYGANYVNGWIINHNTVCPTESGADPAVLTDFFNPKNAIRHAGIKDSLEQDQLLPAYLLPGTAPPSPPASYPARFQANIAGGQIIEFTAGYTIPTGGATGGLNLTSGAPIGGTTATHTITIPAWFGNVGTNGTGTDNEAIEFQRRVGCVLTIKDSEFSRLYDLANKSTRIVGYRRQTMNGPSGLQIVYHRYQILPFDGIPVANTLDFFANAGADISKTPRDKVDFIINGVPFSGTGAGYKATNATNDAGYDGNTPSDYPYALLPNPTDPAYHTNASYYSANEDYDAADYQNMLLAMEHYDDIGMVLTRSPSLHRPALAWYWLNRLATLLHDGTLASLSDEEAWTVLACPDAASPALRNTIVQLKRRCLLRPLSEDHPNFDGSNSRWPVYSTTDVAGKTLAELKLYAAKAWGALNLAPGQTAPWFLDSNGDGIEDKQVVPWDVDNDGDGIPDSIWVDLGLPVRTLPDGRKYKPLAAIHCIDLDGRVNLNTAGTVQQLYGAYAQDPAAVDYLADNTVYAQVLNDSADPSVVPVLSRGQGVGPAEINPMRVLGNSSMTDAQKLNLYRRLLLGATIGNSELDGRYGERDLRQYAPSDEYRWPSPGITPKNDTSYTTSPSTLNRLTLARLFGYPDNYFTAVATGDALAYGAPMDPKGTLFVGLDLFGQPIYSCLGGPIYNGGYQSIAYGWNAAAWSYAGFDSPYQLKLAPASAQSAGLHTRVDNPFTVAELEPLLRRYDTDILRLPSRLRRILGAGTSSLYRLNATTESWDVPVPSMGMSKELRDGWYLLNPKRPAQHLCDLVAARVAANTGVSVPAGTVKLSADQALRVDFSQLLSAGAMLGLRMDLNRPFGNGQDDDNDFVVDEPGETGAAELASRQAYARALYVLMMALVDQTDVDNQWKPYWDAKVANLVSPPGPLTPAERTEARARAIAQWAVNVVDFRDSDSIMTPFEYDVYPFAATSSPSPGELINTWDVDNDVSTNDDNPSTSEHESGVVWGCERPELLITETLAWHDLGTWDTDLDDSGVDIAGGDEDRDQYFAPKGSFFLELFNPQSPSDGKPSELYRNAAGTYTGGVILTKTTTSGSPVWRMEITTREGSVKNEKYYYLDPQEQIPGERTDPIKRDRLVYFVPDNGNLPENGGAYETFYPSESNTLTLAPRKYAVVGPATQKPDGTVNGVTQIGHLTATGAGANADARQIALDPSGTPLTVTGDGVNEEIQPLVAGGSINPPLSLRIDQPRRLNVSEPTGGYSSAPGTWDTTFQEYRFDPPLDNPLDYDTTEQLEADFIFKQEGTHPSYRFAHLQRLANPLADWNAVTNPYITVDTAPVDLTVINGEDNSSGTFDFYSRQRGEGGRGLWAVAPPLLNEQPLPSPNPGDIKTGNPTNHAYAGNFCQSLGYLNPFLGDPLNPGDYPSIDPSYRGAPGDVAGATFTPLPFPWLTWLNRPFANPLELMEAPLMSPSQLTMSYAADGNSASNNHYVTGKEFFGHLPGFFAAVPPPNPVLPTDQPGKMLAYRQWNAAGDHDFSSDLETVPASSFYRVLEYAHVPSRFVDSQTRVNPTYADNPGEQHAFHTPNNFIPNWREPGKINLNTVYGYDVTGGTDSLVWQALGNDYADKMPAWADFLKTRRAYPTAAANDYFGFESVASTDPPLPTRTANPFRSFAGAQLVPPVPGRDPGGADPPYLTGLIQEGVNATLLRAAITGSNYTETLDTRNPLFTSSGTNYYADTQKNPHFQYQSLERLSNLVTNRSNVYAVWITVGYFEVEPVKTIGKVYNPQTNDYIYPEGYTLGQELGIDTGDVTRRRAFYIIDRSIPVGFIPGENLNTEKAVLLKRFIE